MEEFWRNLAGGQDCITEIPKERWDWEEYYGDPSQEPNKTNITKPTSNGAGLLTG
jgi:polyketide synthase PksN